MPLDLDPYRQGTTLNWDRVKKMSPRVSVRFPEWLVSALQASWSRETSSDYDRWTLENPAWGQCAVTALVLQDLMGGELLRCVLPKGGSHYWNRLPSGVE